MYVDELEDEVDEIISSSTSTYPDIEVALSQVRDKIRNYEQMKEDLVKKLSNYNEQE